ncbi:MAG: hypothetical protein ACYDHN_15270 [Solirubrobacteraceae bacterium]
MPLKLGKHPPVFDKRNLVFGNYLKEAAPPTPPPKKNYGESVPTWPMYANDRYGDCTCAAAGHMIQNWTATASTEITVPESSVVGFYEHFVGKPPPEDAGCNMLQVLKYWRRHGLDGHKVHAFAELGAQNLDQTKTAVYLLGSVYIGVALPNFAVHGDMLTIPWVVPAGGAVGDAAPNPNNGHCIPAVGYDESNLYVVTWGEIKTMSWGFLEAYADEVYAVLSLDFINAAGQDAAGLDLAQLEADLKDL